MHPPDHGPEPSAAKSAEHEGARHAELKVKHAGQERDFPVRHGHSLGDILNVLSRELGCPVDELIIVREGEKEPVSAIIVVDEHYPLHRRHHVHLPNPVKVVVYYQAAHHEHEFKRHQTVDDVRMWAIKKFGIDLAVATEIEMALHNHQEHLPAKEHIGHLAGHHHVLELDLVRGPIANG